MFDTISKDTAWNPMARCASLATSLAAHAALAFLVACVPMLVMQNVPRQDVLTFLFAPVWTPVPVIPSPPPGPSRPGPDVSAGDVVSGAHARIPTGEMTMPDAIPRLVPPPSDDYPLWGGASGGHGSGGIGPASGIGIPVADWVRNLPTPIPPPPIPDPVVRNTPLRVGVLKTSKVLLRIPPIYPELARRMHVSGIVHLEALIDEGGNVAGVTVTEGHPLLRDAAVEAVTRWKFTPTIQNGEPIQVIATIRLHFRIE